ncbi:MAG: Ca-activated chloride channel [Campylobacterota bacterium]|nr:Ca-activated chloride channel [Campylobacterota bacterium]
MSFLYPFVFLSLLPLFVLSGYFFVKKPKFLKSKEALLLISALLFIIIALARPYKNLEITEIDSYGTDVVVAIDVSRSMSADDVEPTRFEAAKEMVKKIVSSKENNRYAIVAFTSNALPLSPLTSDKEMLYTLLDSVKLENIITKSTDILKLLKKSAQILKTKEKIVVILSDGGDKKDLSEEIQFAKKNSIKIIFIPIGTRYGSKLYDEFGEVLKDDAKKMVISALNPHIKKAVLLADGIYYESFDEQKVIDDIKNISNELLKTTLETRSNKEYFWIFLFLAFVCFVLATSEIKINNRVFIIILFLGFQREADANIFEAWYEYNAKQSYQAGDFINAAKYYEKLADSNDDYKVAYNLANSYYKLGRFEEASILYEVIKSNDRDFKSDVYYNLANAQAKKEEFEKADQNYLKSLVLRYEADADKNKKIVKNAKKGYKPDSMQKKGEGEKDKASKPKNKNQKEQKTQSESEGGSNKINLTEEEKEMIKKAQKIKPLSYKQYEQINQKAQSNEKNPW